MKPYTDEIIKELDAICAAAELRFFGIVALDQEPDFPRFSAWIDRKAHAGMAFLEKYQERRKDPRTLMEGARTALIFGLNYYQGDRYQPPKAPGLEPVTPRIAQYARLKDYHRLLWQKGELVHQQLLKFLAADPTRHASRVVVDSAPLLERALAARTGRGFIGKNTLFIDPQQGSFFLLGEVITTLELPTSRVMAVDPEQRTEQGGCGTCKRCQVHCPTGALDEAYTLDANKCLAYWTIENRDVIPERFWPWLAQYVFGCDICQLVCPYNRKAEITVAADLVRVPKTPPLFEVATMTHLAYERMFAGTPLTRAKREGLMRNALVAMCVTRDERLDEALEIVREHEMALVLRATLEQIERWRL